MTHFNVADLPNLAALPTAHIDHTRTPVVLVDGSYYLFRCFHGLPPLSNKKGLPTNATRGVLNALNKLIKKYQPTYMAVAFDTKAPTFRHQLSTAYKAHRPPMDDDLRVQIPYIHALIEALGIPLIKIDGFEADDIIGTLAYHAHTAGYPVVISTGDKDMAQLVNDGVILEDSFKGAITDSAGVLDKFGVSAAQIADYLTLMGDASDGIAGIPKVGAKTAAKLLTEYGDIAGILANIDNIKGVVGKNIVDHQDTIPLNRTLATIVTNLPLPICFEDLRLDDSPSAKLQAAGRLYSLYSELEFKNEKEATANLLLRAGLSVDDLARQQAASLATSDHLAPKDSPLFDESDQEHSPSCVERLPKADTHYQTITSMADFESLLGQLRRADRFAIDTETTSLDWQRAELVGISISLANYHAYYIPVGHTGDFDIVLDGQLDRDWVLSALAPILQDPAIGKIGQHLKYDAHIFARYGIHVQGWQMDTMLASYVINAAATRHNMDDLAAYYLGVTTTTFEAVAGKGVRQLSFDKVDIQSASDYACQDADITYRLHSVFGDYLSKNPSDKALLERLELPIALILAQMETDGILVDLAFLQRLSEQFDVQIRHLELCAHELAGETFNASSPKQLGEILFDKLGLSGGKKTKKTGQYSTSEATLSALDHPLAKTILEYRELTKLKSTYTDALALAADKNGRVHTSYHQALTSTGRLSSATPNLQNIPVRTQMGRQIRKAFIAPKGRVIVSADYSQIELRLMAHFSGDDGLIQAFLQGMDIHRATASDIFAKDPNEISSEERRAAKAVNFGLIYGMGAFGLAKQLGVETAVAADYIRVYFSRYPLVHDYMEHAKDMADKHGYVRTILGRKIYTPDIHADNRNVQDAAKRAAINAPLQGSAADIIKLAMLAVDKVLPKDCAKLLLQVHDELIFEVDADKAEQIVALIQDTMQNVLSATACELGWQVNFAVPLVVDVGIGDDWNAAH